MAEQNAQAENNQNQAQEQDQNQEQNQQQQQQSNEAQGKETLLGQAKEGAKKETDGKSLLKTAGEETKQAEIKDLQDKISKSTDEAEKKALQEKLDALNKPAENKKDKVSVPEKYEFKVPEGTIIDEKLSEIVSPIFKELELDNAKAQKLVDVFPKILANIEEANKANFDKFMQDSKDETIKALGAEYQKELAFAVKVMNRFFSTETQEYIDASGLGNNKEFLMDLIKLGKAISEDVFVEGRNQNLSGNEGKSLGQILYPEKK